LEMHIPDKGQSPSIALEYAKVFSPVGMVKTATCPGAPGCDGKWWGPGTRQIA